MSHHFQCAEFLPFASDADLGQGFKCAGGEYRGAASSAGNG